MTLMIIVISYTYIWRGIVNFVMYYDMCWLLENNYFRLDTNKIFDNLDIFNNVLFY